MIPDCTLVTSCFDLTKYHNKSRDLTDSINNMRTLLEVPCYLVIYTDLLCIELIKTIRNSFGLEHLTQYNVTAFEDLLYYKYIDNININRENYWPTKDERTCGENHLLQINKTDFVLQTINKNPFNTTTFGWIDANLGKNFSKICEDYNKLSLLNVLNNVSKDKFHLQILNVTDKKYKQIENKREYYNQYRWVICGSFYTMGKEIGLKVLKKIDELFKEVTELGYGHGDEMIYLEILDEFYDDIERSYGDYGQILNNFIEPTRNLNYIYHFILKKYLDFGYNKECYDCAKVLLKQIESNKANIDKNIYINILFSYYVSAFYHKPDEALSICNHIYDVIHTNSTMLIEFNKNKDFYNSQMKYCNVHKEHQKIVICVFGCATIKKYKDEILKIEETWGKHANDNSVKVLYFLGEEQTDLQDNNKYIYLKGVGNDYLSASNKQNLGLKYIYERYNSDFVFCCGSDTYVNIKKLLVYINQFDANKNLYIGGHGDIRRIGNKEYYYHSGGAGFILSKECLYNIYLHLNNMFSNWVNVCNNVNNNYNYNCEYLISACDVAISYFLQNKLQLNLEIIKNNEAFFGCNYKGLCYNNTFGCCDKKINIDNIISCHNMTLSDSDEYTKYIKLNN